MIVVGGDVGGTKLLARAVDHGDVAAEARRPTGAGLTALGLVEVLASAVAEVASGRPVLALGIGFPGPVPPGGDRVARTVILPAVGEVRLGTMVADCIGIPVLVDNDVTCAARAELALRPGADMLFLAAGTGIGGSLVLHGRLRRGARGLAGEVGHVSINGDGPRCPCGGVGCVHLWAGGRAIEAALGLDEGTLLQADLDAPDARAALNRAGRALGAGIAAATTVLDVALVVVGGGLASLGDRYLDPVRAGFRERAMPEVAAGCRIEPALAGEAAGADGAALLALDASSPEA